jgi:hypothetical protein
MLIVFHCMSLTSFEYRNLGLELVSLEENLSRTPKKPSMVEENKNSREEYPINLFHEQALMRQRDKMMENCFHLLQCLSIKESASVIVVFSSHHETLSEGLFHFAMQT